MNEIINALKEALPSLAIIFIGVFLLILLTRLALSIVIHFAIKKYKKLKEKNPFKRKNIKYEKEEDELLRAIPKAHSATRAANLALQKEAQENFELMQSEEESQRNEELNEVKIVDMVKPIGFWTSMILGQKLTFLIQSAQTINKRGKQGFWVSMIEAQEQAAGRQHGRTR